LIREKQGKGKYGFVLYCGKNNILILSIGIISGLL